ncbi:hypothetical protein [Chamaesiphon sp.]|uniref:hypothetical protein n=1 Tax=Chamaesiphon sp. TaxID=2814140 RepID=UPI003594275C
MRKMSIVDYWLRLSLIDTLFPVPQRSICRSQLAISTAAIDRRQMQRLDEQQSRSAIHLRGISDE